MPIKYQVSKNYRCQVTIGVKKRIDAKQDKVTIGSERDKNPICVKHQQQVSNNINQHMSLCLHKLRGKPFSGIITKDLKDKNKSFAFPM